MNNISKYKPVAFPLLATVALAFGIFWVGSFLFARINTVRSETRAMQSKNTVLSGRLTTLQSLDAGLRQSANTATLAIPEKNPAVLVTRQLRRLAQNHSVGIENLTITSSSLREGEEVLTHDIGFEVVASDYESVSGYISGLSNIVPLVNLATLKVETRPGRGYVAQLKLTAFSSAFPTELPALDEPLSGLSPAEQEILATLESFTRPDTGGTLPEPVDVEPRANPFSLGL